MLYYSYTFLKDKYFEKKTSAVDRQVTSLQGEEIMRGCIVPDVLNMFGRDRHISIYKCPKLTWLLEMVLGMTLYG